MQLKHFTLTATAVIFSISVGCSDDSSDSTTSTSSASSVSSLPGATDEVVSNSSASLKVGGLAATTGVALADWQQSSAWTASTSRAMCEIGVDVRDIIDEVTQPDNIACYVGSIVDNSKVTSSGVVQTTADLATGEYVYMQLVNFPEDPSFKPRIKMKVSMTDGNVTQFEMFSCFANNGATQTEYLNYSISGTTATVTTIYKGTESGNTFGSNAEVTGNVSQKSDGSYEWSSKSFSVQRAYSDGSNSMGQSMSMTQSADSLAISGYRVGAFSNGSDVYRDSNALYAVVQILNDANPIAMALGDGSAKVSFDGCRDTDNDGSCADETGGNKWTFNTTDSWNGDTRAKLGTASDGDYYSQVNSESLTSVGSTPTISFTTAQTWDCSSPSGTFLQADLTDFSTSSTALGAAIASCDQKYSFSNNHTDGWPCQNAQ